MNTRDSLFSPCPRNSTIAISGQGPVCPRRTNTTKHENRNLPKERKSHGTKRERTVETRRKDVQERAPTEKAESPIKSRASLFDLEVGSRRSVPVTGNLRTATRPPVNSGNSLKHHTLNTNTQTTPNTSHDPHTMRKRGRQNPAERHSVKRRRQKRPKARSSR